MISNRILTFITFICICTSLCLGWLLINGKKSTLTVQQSQTFSKEDKMRLFFYKALLPETWKDDGKQINLNIKTTDNKNKAYSLKELVDGSPKLVFRYSYTDCEMCVDTVLTHLSNPHFKSLLSKTIILTDSFSERDFMIKTSNMHLPKEINNIGTLSLGLDNEGKNQPFFFVIGNTGSISKIFFPLKEIPKDIDGYLDQMMGSL